MCCKLDSRGANKNKPRYFRGIWTMALRSIISYWILVQQIVLVKCIVGRNISDTLFLDYRLRWISARISAHGLEYLLDSPNITLFLPDNQAMARFDENQFGYATNDTETLRKLILYHSVDKRLNLDDLRDNTRLRSRTQTRTLLYFNTLTAVDGSKIYAVNGAKLTTSPFEAENGVLYIIDKVMAPFGSNKTITEYDNRPDLPYLSFNSITAVAEINRPLYQRGRSDQYLFTVFSPNDSYTYPIPRHAQERFYTDWQLINDTIKAHIIEGEVVCLPEEGNIPALTTLNGQMTFSRMDGKLYVENNRVRAEVIIPNIPLQNGVLHVIDNLLFFVYNSVYQKLQELPDAATFSDVASNVQTYLDMLRSDEKITLFVPVASAFAKVSPRTQGEVLNNITRITELLRSHVVVGQDLDVASLLTRGDITTLSGRVLRVVSMNNNVYIEHNGMRTLVTRGDIGCTNGVIHLINDVMIDSRLTVWENIESQTQLSFVHELMRNHVDIRTTLSADDGSHVTVFLPGTFFLEDLPLYSRQMLNAGGSVVHEALNGHIVQESFLGSSVFKEGIWRELRTKNGDFLRVTRRGQEIVLNGTHVTGSVSVSDIWCSNGVIHIIDSLLHVPTRNALDEMQRREDTRIASNLFAASRSIRRLLMSNNSRLSVFVPSDRGIAKIPVNRAQLLRQNAQLLDRFVGAHVVRGAAIFSKTIPQLGQLFDAEEGKLHIAASRDKLYVKSQGVGAWFKKTDVPVTNGVIHVIDGPLWLAYQTVEEALVTRPELRPFYTLISGMAETTSAIQSGRPVTVFAPSSEYFLSIQTKLPLLRANDEFKKQLVYGHIIPGINMDEAYVDSREERWRTTSRHNITFHFKKETPGSFSVGVYKDYRVDITRAEIRCTNGVIYLVDYFLNFAPFTPREVANREPTLRNTFGTLVRQSWNSYIANSSLVHTILAPDDSVASKQGRALTALFNNQEFLEQVTWRHISLGQILPVGDLLSRSVQNNFTSNGVTFSKEGNGVFASWGGVKARIVRSNILTTHGIIHVVDKILFKIDVPGTTPSSETPMQTTVKQKARTSKSINASDGASEIIPMTSLLSLALTMLLLLRIQR